MPHKLQSNNKNHWFRSAALSFCVVGMMLLCSVSSGFSNSEKERRFPLLFNMVHHNPGEPQFVTHYDEPGYLKQLGYNGQIPKLSPQCGLTYDKAYLRPAEPIIKIRG